MKYLLLIAGAISLATSIKAEGLSWTNPNKDTTCHMLVCSEATIHQFDAIVNGVRIYTLVVTMIVYPSVVDGDDAKSITERIADADSISMRVVLETSDHVKHTYLREKVQIVIDEGEKVRSRHCAIDIGIPDTGVISVLAIDASEVNAKGEILSRHVFR